MQTQKPYRWIIVDDGSTDDTEKRIKVYAKNNEFISYIKLEDRGYRAPALGVINAFYRGFEIVKNEEFDVVAKLDADLKFPNDTLEKIVFAFDKNPKLGITGGIRYDYNPANGGFKKVLVPPNFVGGPTKFYRKECFLDIGGLLRRAGWDGVDTVKANMAGWETRELESIKILHLKPTGFAVGEGLERACLKYGDVSYYMGGYFWYFLFRVVGRSLKDVNLRIGFYMLMGYFTSLSKKLDRESHDFRKFLKKQQLANMKSWIKKGYTYIKRNSNLSIKHL